MRAIREPGMLSGFVLEQPLESIPELTHINEVICHPRYQLQEHTHPGYEFHFLKVGTMTWQVGDQTYPQRAGELFIFPPGLKHRLAKEPVDRGQVHALAMGLDLHRWKPYRKNLLQQLSHLQLQPIRGPLDYESLMHILFRYCLRGGNDFKRVIRAHIDLFLLQLEEQPGYLERRPEKSQVYTYPVEKALHFMEENLDRKLILNDIARIAQLAPTYFSNRFRQEVGVPPVAYHLRLRLHAARNALQNPDADLTAIALNHGFGSLQHFHSRFRQQFGVAPGAYRNRFRYAVGSKGET